jgi:hypothetical protein
MAALREEHLTLGSPCVRVALSATETAAMSFWTKPRFDLIDVVGFILAYPLAYAFVTWLLGW